MHEWPGGRGRELVVCQVRPGTLEVFLDVRLEILKRGGFNVKLPLQVRAHLALHLVNLPEGKHSLTDDTPGLVGVGVITDDLGSNHEGGDEQAVAGGTASGDEPRLQSLEEVECSKGHRGCESRAMECVGDETREVWGRGVV